VGGWAKRFTVSEKKLVGCTGRIESDQTRPRTQVLGEKGETGKYTDTTTEGQGKGISTKGREPVCFWTRSDSLKRGTVGSGWDHPPQERNIFHPCLKNESWKEEGRPGGCEWGNADPTGQIGKIRISPHPEKWGEVERQTRLG